MDTENISDEEVTITVKVRKSTLQHILNIFEQPDCCYPSMEDAQDFFELNGDFHETLADEAKKLGLVSNSFNNIEGIDCTDSSGG